MLAATQRVRYDERWAADKNHSLSVHGDWVCQGCLQCLKSWGQIEVGFAASSHITFRFFCPCNDIWFSPHWEERPSIGLCPPVHVSFVRWRNGLCAVGLTDDAFIETLQPPVGNERTTEISLQPKDVPGDSFNKANQLSRIQVISDVYTLQGWTTQDALIMICNGLRFFAFLQCIFIISLH